MRDEREDGAVNDFMWGALAMASWVAGLLFLRYYRDTRDRLFRTFGLAFWVLSLNWILLAVLDPPNETRHYFYVVRLIAFLLIIWAVFDKNRERNTR
jgi:hypothetical protein